MRRLIVQRSVVRFVLHVPCAVFCACLWCGSVRLPGEECESKVTPAGGDCPSFYRSAAEIACLPPRSSLLPACLPARLRALLCRRPRESWWRAFSRLCLTSSVPRYLVTPPTCTPIIFSPVRPVVSLSLSLSRRGAYKGRGEIFKNCARRGIPSIT